MDFKSETLNHLQKHFGADYQIDSYRLSHHDNTIEGRGEIDWDKVRDELDFTPNFSYNEGYGADEVTGFITVKNHAAWLERVEYDGSSWWVFRSRPELTTLLS